MKFYKCTTDAPYSVYKKEDGEISFFSWDLQKWVEDMSYNPKLVKMTKKEIQTALRHDLNRGLLYLIKNDFYKEVLGD
jgi:hypothetical protein